MEAELNGGGNVERERGVVEGSDPRGQSVQFSRSVASNPLQPMDCSAPGFPVHHQLWSLLKLMSIESVMPSNHLFLCCPLLLLPSIFPSIRVFSNESVLPIRWPKFWSFSISPSSEYSGLISFRMDWFDLFEVQGSQVFSSTTVQKQRSTYGCVRTERARRTGSLWSGGCFKDSEVGVPRMVRSGLQQGATVTEDLWYTGPAGAEGAVLTSSTGRGVTQANRRHSWCGETMNQGLKPLGKEGDCQNWKIRSGKLDSVRLRGRRDFFALRMEKYLGASL